MPRSEMVRVGDAEFFVTVVDNGPVQVGGKQSARSFDGIRETLHAVASEVAAVWHEVRPDEATVEFGLSATAQAGKLTGLIVDGGAEAAFKVSMTWRASAEQPLPQPGLQPVEHAPDGEAGSAAQEGTSGE